jgi:hypothetical protein
MNRKIPLAAALLAAALAAPARAAVSAGVSEATGNNDYQSVRGNASVDIGDSWTLSPNYTRYKTDFTNGTYNDYGARLGFETGPLALGVNGSVLPAVDGYSQGSFGGDLTFTLTPEGSPHGRKMAGPDSSGADAGTFGAGLAAVDVGVSVQRTQHRDDLMLQTPGSSPFGPTTARATPYELGQTDLSAFAGLKFLFTELSAQVVKSQYDKSLSGTQSVRAAPYLSLLGVTGIEQGYPDLGYNLRLKWKTLPLVQPYATYTHMTYELGESPSNAFQVGGTVGLKMLNVNAGWEHYSQVGTPSRDYVTVGAGLNFGS